MSRMNAKVELLPSDFVWHELSIKRALDFNPSTYFSRANEGVLKYSIIIPSRWFLRPPFAVMASVYVQFWEKSRLHSRRYSGAPSRKKARQLEKSKNSWPCYLRGDPTRCVIIACLCHSSFISSHFLLPSQTELRKNHPLQSSHRDIFQDQTVSSSKKARKQAVRLLRYYL